MKKASGSKVVCFIDIDGVMHAQGASRYNDLLSKVVGVDLFCGGRTCVWC